MSTIPAAVKTFIVQFHKHFTENNTIELLADYETGFNKLTDKYYAKQPWPEPISEVGPLVENDQVFLVLYSEVYYRHIYAKLEPTLHDRSNLYTNYCNLFNLVLNHEGGPVTFELPAKWLWDIVDEFVYQCNQFAIYRLKLVQSVTLDPQEVAFVQQHPEIWLCYLVLNALYLLIGRLRICEQLKNGTKQEVAGPYGALPLYRNLGYFSLVGLLRIHTLLGDFALALKTMDDVGLGKKGFSSVPGAQFSTYYYVGFCYLMMHRYSDAIRTFLHILSLVQRTKKNKVVGQYDAVTKRSEQMYALLALLVGLCPTRLDDVLFTEMKTRFSDQMAAIYRGGENGLKTIEELFVFGAPKFMLPLLPNFDVPAVNVDAVFLHLLVFMVPVRNAMYNNTLKTYLRLYLSLELTKLLAFLQDEDVQINDLDELKQLLMSFKLTNTQIEWSEEKEEESLVNGEPGSVYDFDIVLDGDLIRVVETKMARKFSEWFLRNLAKNNAVRESLKRN